MSLHNKVLNEVTPYIILPEDRLKRNLEDLPKNQQEAIKNYNYRYAGDAFCPHITIGRSTSKNETILKEMNMAICNFDLSPYVEKVTVYQMGTNGTHKNTLYEIAM